ncbi:hypothetical protein QOT17_017631 [Balamuthia mandrillaris]
MGKHGGGTFGGGHHHHSSSPSYQHHHHHHYHTSYRPSYTSSSSVTYFGGGGGGFRVRARSPFLGLCVCLFCFGVFFIVVMALAPWHASTEKVELATFETELVDPSTLWSAKVEVEVPPENVARVRSYKFSHKPPHTPQKVNRTEQQALSVPYGSYEYYAYHLLPGSVVSVNWTADASLDWYLIKGEHNFDKWANHYDQSWMMHVYAAGDNNTFQARTEDDYFVAWLNRQKSVTVAGKANFTLQLTTYNLSNPKETCQQSSCTFDLDRSSSDARFSLALSLSLSLSLYSLLTMTTIGGSD